MAAKIHPQISSSSSNSCSNYVTSKRETLTIWMKSLVFHGNGCTAYNSKGEIVFRVDNYQEKNSTKVYLMDLHGQVLFSIQKQKLRIFGRWNGYKWNSSSGLLKGRPWFQVRRSCRFLKRDLTCNVGVGSCDKIIHGNSYMLKKSDGKSAFKIVDHSTGNTVAEVKQKQSSQGLAFGEDVLSLVVEPQIDQSLIMAIIVTVFGLVNCKL
ncbi:PREDICTED: protein LURP-one-related 11-like [Ipomoea nil]|uniref:protein LURP-one-related 11-like n=1 Tax=Ipomoea nil TaxID=35883 RepID=UPI000901FABD|nr:PREDICTED: protein LURP-one-related 11-like [Ipomoea nil]